jgi:ADP-heptose:LPS heptosyltransferase
MGSLLLSTPALALARRAFPEARLTFLTFQKNRELVERISTIDAVLTIDHSSVRAFLRETIWTIRSIIRIHADITFDLEFFSKFSTLLSGFSQAPIRVAFALPTYWRSSIVTHQVPLEKNRHVVHSFCEQVLCISDERINIPPIEAPYVGEQDHASLLRKFSIEGRRLVAINVNAGDTFLERRWPADRFARLVSALAREEDCIFCFTGSRGESDYVRSVIHETDCSEKCIDTSGVLTVPELAALLQRCDILISNDSGPLHLAASLGTPTVGLYGPESPDFYGVVQVDSRVIYKKVSCSPCMNIYSAKQFRCPYNARCMRELSVDQVLQSVRSSILIEE